MLFRPTIKMYKGIKWPKEKSKVDLAEVWGYTVVYIFVGFPTNTFFLCERGLNRSLQPHGWLGLISADLTFIITILHLQCAMNVTMYLNASLCCYRSIMLLWNRRLPWMTVCRSPHNVEGSCTVVVSEPVSIRQQDQDMGRECGPPAGRFWD